MIYPLNKTCPTQPRISIRYVNLINITSVGGLLPAGIIRCNETNPCQSFYFQDVNIRSKIWDKLDQGYIVEHVRNGISHNSFPDPKFGKSNNADNTIEFDENLTKVVIE